MFLQHVAASIDPNKQLGVSVYGNEGRNIQYAWGSDSAEGNWIKR